MRQHYNTLAMSVFLFVCFLSSCNSSPSVSPEVAAAKQQTLTMTPRATALPTNTNTPEPTQTPTNTEPPPSTPTETITLTPSPMPTLEFYASDPTIEATSESCSSVPSKMCASGLHITFPKPGPSNYEVTVSWPGFSGTSFTCPQVMTIVSFGENMAPVACDDRGITFVSVGLKELTVSIKWDGVTSTATLYPVYTVSAPEGENCEPQCVLGEAEMPLE